MGGDVQMTLGTTLKYEITFDYDDENILLGQVTGLPPGWTLDRTSDGHPYYFNKATKKSVWKKPKDGNDISIHIELPKLNAEERHDVPIMLRNFLKPMTNGKRTLSKMLKDPVSQNKFKAFLTEYDLD